MNDKKPLMDYRRAQKLQTPLLLTGALLSGVGTSVSVPLVILGIAIMLFAIVKPTRFYGYRQVLTLAYFELEQSCEKTRCIALLARFCVRFTGTRESRFYWLSPLNK